MLEGRSSETNSRKVQVVMQRTGAAGTGRKRNQRHQTKEPTLGLEEEGDIL